MQTLIVLARRPLPGRVKTRLTPPLSEERAAAIYECFLRDTLAIMRQVPDVERVVGGLPGTEEPYFRQLAPDMQHVVQRGTHLGERIHHLLSDSLEGGATAAVVMVSDSPTLPAPLVARAFEHLAQGYDVVLGPCDDGGYYLIGLRSPCARLFEVRMSTPRVLQETRAHCDDLGLRVAQLPGWYDIDDTTGLQRLCTELEAAPEEVAPFTRACLRQQEYGCHGGAGRAR